MILAEDWVSPGCFWNLTLRQTQRALQQKTMTPIPCAPPRIFADELIDKHASSIGARWSYWSQMDPIAGPKPISRAHNPFHCCRCRCSCVVCSCSCRCLSYVVILSGAKDPEGLDPPQPTGPSNNQLQRCCVLLPLLNSRKKPIKFLSNPTPLTPCKQTTSRLPMSFPPSVTLKT